MTSLCSQHDGVAHSRTQVGQDIAGGCGRDLLLLDLTIFGAVHQLVGADLSSRFLPPQGEGGLCGLDFFEISGRVEI